MTRILAVLLVQAVLILPSYADDGADLNEAPDLAVLSDCFSNASSVESALTCAGATYQSCLDRAGRAVSHKTEGDCLDRERLLWLGLEHDAFQTFQTSLGQHGKETIASEEAWQRYLSAQCEMEMAKWGEGNIVLTAGPNCHIRRIIERLVLLRDLQGAIEKTK